VTSEASLPIGVGLGVHVAVGIVTLDAADGLCRRRSTKARAHHEARPRVTSELGMLGRDFEWLEIDGLTVALAAEAHLLVRSQTARVEDPRVEMGSQDGF